ncbi:MAG: glycosyltransferase family 4 protein [Magnetococcales bacterium]|nr:glycosyltransferase family 4 protein [Magnetococcales bacterium]
MELADLRLTLFFTVGMSLHEWDRLGMFGREVALYQALRPHLGGISFVTHGDRQDLAYRDRLAGIDIYCNRFSLSWPWYWRWLVGMPAGWKRGAVVFKSNQIPGSETPLALAKRFGKPFIARCGYMHSDFTISRFGADSPEARKSLDRERRSFQGADRVVVTTPRMAAQVTGMHGVPADRVRVIPNYVDTDLFAPRPASRGSDDGAKVFFLGRLDVQKDPFLLLDAMHGIDAALWMVGDGPLREALTSAIAARGARVELLGIRPHAALPELMNRSDLFVLPSPYEGHPKALLEAMACGMAVIGRNDAPGVREVIRHEETGLLCDPTPEGLRAAITRLLSDPDLKGRLGRNARAHALETFSLQRVVEMELALLREIFAISPA